MKLFFTILISFSIGWMVHSFLDKNTHARTTPLKIPDCASYNELSTPKTVEKIVIKDVIKFVPKTKIIYRRKKKEDETNSSKKDLFLIALENNEFDEAMEYYQDADEEKHPLYQTALFSYFERLQRKEPLKIEEQIQSFIEIEPESKIFVFQLVELLKKQDKYLEALNTLIDFSYVVSYNAKNSVYGKIKSISLEYIKKLTSSKSLQPLIEFLLNRINRGVLSDFYSFELAKIYIKMKQYNNAINTLEDIKDSKTYKERANEMLVYIQNKLEEQNEYPIQIPLIRKGLHFLVKVYIDNVPATLLIDTGASITSVDYNKISHLTVIKENVKFNTAGGDIYETMFKVDTFTVDKVSLENFRISSLQFTGGSQDGLLGMNFLGRFKFKIDQEEAILFLGDKN